VARQIFVNLPVTDLDRSIRFFTALGFTLDERFTDETATNMIVSETIFVMLLTHGKFRPSRRTRSATRGRARSSWFACRATAAPRSTRWWRTL
jgi:predicted lactoylglutathione lyase